MSVRQHVRVALACVFGLALLCGGSPRKEPQPASPIQSSEWLAGSWSRRVQITVKPDSIEGAGSLLDFSVLLRLGPAHASIFAAANANGSDIRITKSDGTTTLGHEVVSFDPIAQKGEIWFKADILSKNTNVFYLYYGNPLETTLPPAGTAWNSQYLAVYHFEENPALGVLRDYGPHGNDGRSAVPRANWTSSDVAPGQMGQAWNFNGTSHWIDGDAISTQDSSYVISAWLMCPSNTVDFTFQANPGFWHVSAQINEMHRQPHFGDASDLRWEPRPLPNDDLFHYYTWVFDGEADTILFYFDGELQPATPHNLAPGRKHFYTGRPINTLGGPVEGTGILGPMSWNGQDHMTGPGDEFHLNVRTHSAAWIRTEYRNQRDPEGFFEVGAEEVGSWLVPVVLLSFTAAREEVGVRISWEAAVSGNDVAGFWVYRGEQEGTREVITPSLVTGEARFEWLDTSAPAEGAAYWIGAVSRTGEVTFFGPRTVGPARLFLVGRSHPNPFGRITQLSWTAGSSGKTSVRMLDANGGRVRTLVDAFTPDGAHVVVWDGRDDAGRRVPSGIYFFAIEHGSDRAVRKVLFLPQEQ